MSIAKLSVAAAIVAIAAGCGPQKIDATPVNTVEVDGLSVSLELPDRQFRTGQQARAVVVARNLTDRPIPIDARTGAPVYIRILRFTGISWEDVKRYPEAATMVMSPWTLDAGAQRTFVMNLTVEPDWPTGEIIRITAGLNGREEASPGLAVEVMPPTVP